jgi:hypothetical protein
MYPKYPGRAVLLIMDFIFKNPKPTHYLDKNSKNRNTHTGWDLGPSNIDIYNLSPPSLSPLASDLLRKVTLSPYENLLENGMNVV